MRNMFLLIIYGVFVLTSSSAFADGDVYNGPTTASSSSAANSATDSKSTDKPSEPPNKNAAEIKQSAAALIKVASHHCGKDAGVKALTDYDTKYNECTKKEGTATTMCLDSFSPSIQKSLPLIQAAISAMGSGVVDSCSSAANALKLANEALTAFQGTCAAAKGFCDSSCSEAVNTLQKGKAAAIKCAEAGHAEAQAECMAGSTSECAIAQQITTAKEKLVSSIEPELNQSDKSTSIGRKQTCGNYSAQLASALTGGIGMLKSMGQANNCNLNTSALNALATPLNCEIEPNKSQNQECICRNAPRTPGCPNLDNALNANSASQLGSADLGNYTPGSTGAGSSGLDGMNDIPFSGGSGAASTSSGPGAPSGGGAGIDGGSGFSGNGDGHGKAGGSNLNTNILAGEGGGSGGGGGYGSHGGDGEGALRKYLPGGERDPAALKMTGQGASAGITSQGGKSNWEKVRERYRDNNPTLLGN